jgi:hypothetical protein
MTPGRNGSNNTSAVLKSSNKVLIATGFFRSKAIERLFLIEFGVNLFVIYTNGRKRNKNLPR